MSGPRCGSCDYELATGEQGWCAECLDEDGIEMAVSMSNKDAVVVELLEMHSSSGTFITLEYAGNLGWRVWVGGKLASEGSSLIECATMALENARS